MDMRKNTNYFVVQWYIIYCSNLARVYVGMGGVTIVI